MIRGRTSPIGLFLVAFGVLGILAGPARAQLVDEEGVGRLTIGGGVGLLVPAMGDVNDNIRVANPFLQRDEIRKMDSVKETLLSHLDVRFRLGRTPPEDPMEETGLVDRISIGFSWGAVNARSEINDITRVRTRFYSRATTYYAYLLYHFPFFEQKVPRLQLTAGGGPWLLRNGSVEWEIEDRTNNIFLVDGDISELAGSAKASGSATGFVLQAGGSYMLSRRFSIAGDIGYRRGKMSNVTLDEAVGQDKRFPGDEDPETEDIVRRPGDWAVIDFFKRDTNAVFEGRKRTDPEDDGGCETCPLYYEGDPLEVDYSGPFLAVTLRAHFF
jgi:hypothetical protein